MHAWVLWPIPFPRLWCPSARVSARVGCAPFPSSICAVAGALVCGRCSSLLPAFKPLGIAIAHSRQADVAPRKAWNTEAKRWPDYPVLPGSEICSPTFQFLP
ncbi:hypothetical protein TIFTF001_054296 [Ficus carica]|uniref:Uncharacterized protein n=1 Tax=Ficus carica TaxID=3494 RepID=A0AA88CXA5_FICCA|nr:hypothetical protein TIFTF001_004500 [Ficus carica]GMN73257.1 hypothetical protein TIFTF001_054296 [Ficus carica]